MMRIQLEQVFADFNKDILPIKISLLSLIFEGAECPGIQVYL